jgi:DNA polymerase
MVTAVIDFETRSRLKLNKPKNTNSYKYSQHSSTEVLCMGYSIDGEPRHVWRPLTGVCGIGQWSGFPFADVWPLVRILAFNAEFELNIWNNVCVPRYDWPVLEEGLIECLRARAAYAGLPRNLEGVCVAAGLGELGKDAEGRLNMLSLCKPVKRPKLIGCEYFGGEFDETPAKHKRNEQYCLQDIRCEQIVSRLCPPLPGFEQKLWQVHCRINERGIPVDVPLCRNVEKLTEMENARLTVQLKKLTGDEEMTPTKLQRIKQWVTDQGAFISCMRDDTLTTILADKKVPDHVKNVLSIRKLTRDAAVAKFSAILRHEHHGRCSGAHVYYQAGTGRFQASGVNFQNLRRLNKNEIPSLVKLADRVSAADDRELKTLFEELQQTKAGVIPTLGSMARMSVCASPGKKLVVRDYSAIEMRVLHWLAGDEQMLKQIRRFDRGKGEEPYKLAAAMIFNIIVSEVTDEQRQRGKVFILGCGYMASGEKFRLFCLQYGIEITLEEADRLVQLYRRSYPLVKRLWYAYQNAAVRAVLEKGTFDVGPVTFWHGGNTLNVRLPSGRNLKYYDAKIEKGPYGEEVDALDMRTDGRRRMTPATWTENIDQAVSRDLLADALIKCEQQNLPVVLHVYDEAVVEVGEENNTALDQLGDIMKDTPAWAKGLPIASGGGESRRYCK